MINSGKNTFFKIVQPYFDKRTYAVKCGICTSIISRIHSGVPQEHKDGPICKRCGSVTQGVMPWNCYKNAWLSASGRGLVLSLHKSNLIKFTLNRHVTISSISLYGETIPQTTEVKYLALVLEAKLQLFRK